MDKVGLPEYMRELAKTLGFGEELLLAQITSLDEYMGELRVKQEDEIDKTQDRLNAYESLALKMKGLSEDLFKEFPNV